MAVGFVILSIFVTTFSAKDFTLALDNGLARTPPMGWMNWERFRCNIDCDKYPDTCVSERLFMQMADHLASDGYRDVGYEYVSIDDCWANKERDSFGRLQPNSTRFPSGMRALADYIHAKGLKLGMYADYGVFTCAGYPGSISHVGQDAKTFAGWGVDYLKVDGCYANPKNFPIGYPKFSKALNGTGIPIVLSCEWPVYQVKHGIKTFASWGADYLKLDTCWADPRIFDVGYLRFGKALNATGRPILYSCGWPKAQIKVPGLKVNYTAVAETCNTWRNYIDIQDSWDTVLEIVDYFAANQDTFAAIAGPGHWNDPDQLIIGDFGLSLEESKAQFALWSILAAPLTMSNDLRNIADEFKEILLNREVIAVNQDQLGKMGKRVFSKDSLEVWSRPLMNGCKAVLLFNRKTNEPYEITADFALVGLLSNSASVRDLYLKKNLGVFNHSFSATVNPSGVVLVKLTPLKDRPFIKV